MAAMRDLQDEILGKLFSTTGQPLVFSFQTAPNPVHPVHPVKPRFFPRPKPRRFLLAKPGKPVIMAATFFDSGTGNAMSRLTFMDLFCGCGGFSLGLKPETLEER